MTTLAQVDADFDRLFGNVSALNEALIMHGLSSMPRLSDEQLAGTTMPAKPEPMPVPPMPVPEFPAKDGGREL